MNIEVGNNKYYLHKRYTEFLMLHQVRKVETERALMFPDT